MNRIVVLGVGPGSPDYLLPAVKKEAINCDVLIGGKRNLSLFQDYEKEKIVLGANINEVIERIKELRSTKKLGILVSGDPGFYSFLNTLLKHFSRDELKVLPGISSLQYLFAKGVLSWQDALLTSLHGRRLEDLADLVRKNSRIAFLTDSKFPPSKICSFLLESGVKNKRVLVGENLSYPEEQIRDLSIEQWAGQKTDPLCVMVIYDE